MITNFVPKEIVWAKVQSSPWWPAQIAKVPSKDHQFYRVIFLCEQTHAFMKPHDLRKYSTYHEEFSAKKSKKLQKAIIEGDRQILIREKQVERQQEKLIKRINKGSKATSPPQDIKKVDSWSGQGNAKVLKQKTFKRSLKVLKIEQKAKKDKQELEKREKKDQQHDSESDKANSDQNSEEDSQEEDLTPNISDHDVLSAEKDISALHIDRNKIDKYEGELMDIVSNIQHSKQNVSEKSPQFFNIFDHYPQHEQFIKGIDPNYFTPEQLCQSKIPKIISFILKHTPYDPQKQMVLNLSNSIKTKIKAYLFNTEYYDSYIKQIAKTKNHKEEFSRMVSKNLVKYYLVRKDLAAIFAEKISNNIGSSQEKEFLNDLREKRIDANIAGISSKASAQRTSDQVVLKYEFNQ